jgi:hypothetical protein
MTQTSAPNPQLIYTLTVPCFPDSLMVLEGLAETFIDESSHLPGDIALVLRLSVSEACRNALNQGAPQGRLNLVTMSVWRLGPADVFDFALEIEDPGTGLQIGGFKPPYRSFQQGTETTLLRVLGQDVKAHIEDAYQVRLFAGKADSSDDAVPREALIQGASEKGLGLLALVRCWQTVIFSYDEEKGTKLRLEKPKLVL